MFQTDRVNEILTFTANRCLFFLISEQETVVLNPYLAGEQVKTTFVWLCMSTGTLRESSFREKKSVSRFCYEILP